MKDAVSEIIARIPEWAKATDVAIRPLGGLTNTCYLVTVDGEDFALRVSGKNTIPLGIDRESELEVLMAAWKAGIGPEVVEFLLPEGHMVTRLIRGRLWEVEEYRTPMNLRRIVRTVKQLHSLAPVKATFSPFQRVASYAVQTRAFGVPFPEDFDGMIQKMRSIEADQRRDTDPWLCFCHNDLFGVNFLDTGDRIRIIDWEFAGMGDRYFDLAALVYAYDEDGPLPSELEELLLETYFGKVTAKHHDRLEGMKFMLLFFTAMWGLLHHGMQRNGIIPPFEDLDCLDYAQQTFASMRKCR